VKYIYAIHLQTEVDRKAAGFKIVSN